MDIINNISNLSSDIYDSGYLFVPNYISYIDDQVFKNNEELEIIEISDDVPNSFFIGKNAFENCKNLRKVYIGNNVKLLKEFAFKNCGNNTSKLEIYFGRTPHNSNLTEIGKGCFSDSNISYLELPSNLKVINEIAFKNCHNLNYFFINTNENNFSSMHTDKENENNTFTNCPKLFKNVSSIIVRGLSANKWYNSNSNKLKIRTNVKNNPNYVDFFIDNRVNDTYYFNISDQSVPFNGTNNIDYTSVINPESMTLKQDYILPIENTTGITYDEEEDILKFSSNTKFLGDVEDERERTFINTQNKKIAANVNRIRKNDNSTKTNYVRKNNDPIKIKNKKKGKIKFTMDSTESGNVITNNYLKKNDDNSYTVEEKNASLISNNDIIELDTFLENKDMGILLELDDGLNSSVNEAVIYINCPDDNL